MADSSNVDSRESEVDLGFLEEIDEALQPNDFPSKVGGRPVWLNPSKIPHTVVCKACGNNALFLGQVYAPKDSVSTAYHRTLYVFCCANGQCYKHGNCITVLRDQLPEINDFFSSDLSVENSWSTHFSAIKFCELCGCASNKACSACHQVSYCSKYHQTLHWKKGHKRECGKYINSKDRCRITFPEYELVTEPEPSSDACTEEVGVYEEKYEQYLQESNVQKVDKKMERELMKMEEKKTDDMFERFKKRIKREPKQVLRYDEGGTPLWVSDENIPRDEDIPPCQCGAPRVFEFQIMPQLLNYLSIDTSSDSMDWGTLAVYSCPDSCPLDEGMREEFVWMQHFSYTDDALN